MYLTFLGVIVLYIILGMIYTSDNDDWWDRMPLWLQRGIRLLVVLMSIFPALLIAWIFL